jgi:hypothetical protein
MSSGGHGDRSARIRVLNDILRRYGLADGFT